MLPYLLIASLVIVAMLFFWTRLAPTQATAFTLAFGRRLAGMRRREIKVSGSRIAYLEGGRGVPLILFHGAGADKDNFILVARELRKHYRVIVPDLPGFGESDRSSSASYGVADQVARLASFASAVGADRFHLGGNSMGGLLACAMSVAFPDRVLSLWLLAPAGVQTARPSELFRRLEAGERLPIFARNATEMRAVMAFVTHKLPFMPSFVIEAMSRRQAEHFVLNESIVAQLIKGPWLEQLMAHGPTTPALIVWGDRDRALDCSGAAILHSLLPNSKVMLMPDIGHVPMIEAPAKAVRDYLQFQAAPPR